VNTVNVYDAAKYGIESNWVENGVDVESTVTIKIIDEAFEERIKKEVGRMFMMLPYMTLRELGLKFVWMLRRQYN
jgi:ribosomal protein S25